MDLSFNATDSILITELGRINVDRTKMPTLFSASQGQAVKSAVKD